MIALIRLVLGIVTSLFKSTAQLEAESAALRRQLAVLRRKMPGRVKLTNDDRCLYQKADFHPFLTDIPRINPWKGGKSSIPPGSGEAMGVDTVSTATSAVPNVQDGF